MEEKRKSRRFILEAEIEMQRVDPGKKKSVPITVQDVSKTGIGFLCDEILEMNSVYRVNLKIWTGDIMTCFINVCRFDNSGQDYVYGGIFIGMPDADAQKFDIYELFKDEEEK